MNLLLLSLVTFTAYVVFIWYKYGVQSSISLSYYKLPGKYKYIFTLALWSFSIPVIIMGGNELMFVAGSFICFVGASPAYNSVELERKVHVVGAFGGIIFGILALIINYHFYYLVGISVIAGLIIQKYAKNSVWWNEILAFMVIWSGVLINYIVNL